MIHNGLNPLTCPLTLAFCTSTIWLVAFVAGFTAHSAWSQGDSVWSDNCRVLTILASVVSIVSGLALVLQWASSALGPMIWRDDQFLAALAALAVECLLVRALVWCVSQRRLAEV